MKSRLRRGLPLFIAFTVLIVLTLSYPLFYRHHRDTAPHAVVPAPSVLPLP